MKSAISKLKRRIAELDSVKPESIEDIGDPRIEAVRMKIDDTLVEIFGQASIEYKRYSISELYGGLNFIDITTSEIRRGYVEGFARARATLNTIIDLFEEKIQDPGTTLDAKASIVFADLSLHPEIERATTSLFQGGHFANAIEDACKVLDGLVKMRSGKFELSGTDLMHTVFSPKNPILRFNDLITETDKSEQQGMMYLYAGAMLAFRNPRAHGIVEDDPQTAVEVISFVSFLAKELDKAKKG
jgi:uncharacterized protein (TIGR02391 family)